MGMVRTSAWFETSAEAGLDPLPPAHDAVALRLGPLPSEPPAPPARRVTIDMEVPEDALRSFRAGGEPVLPPGCPVVIHALNDPDLEDHVLGLYEAEAAGIGRGELRYMVAMVGLGGMHRAAFADSDRAASFLQGEVETAARNGGGDHWEAMLEGDDEGEGYPVLWHDGEALGVLDGLHRLAGLVANDRPGTEAILALPPDVSIQDCPGMILYVPGCTYPEYDAPASPGGP